MSEINERVRYIRESKGLNQTDFGKQIGLSRDAIANIEGDRVGVKDLTISMICREFNVSEEWLREGIGEPFIKMDDEDIIMECVGRIMSEDSDRRRVIAFLSQMSPENFEVLMNAIKGVAEAIKKED